MSLLSDIRGRDYAAENKRRNEQRKQTMLAKYGQDNMSGYQMPQIRMIVSPWYVDIRDGLPTRTVRAAQ